MEFSLTLRWREGCRCYAITWSSTRLVGSWWRHTTTSTTSAGSCTRRSDDRLDWLLHRTSKRAFHRIRLPFEIVYRATCHTSFISRHTWYSCFLFATFLVKYLYLASVPKSIINWTTSILLSDAWRCQLRWTGASRGVARAEIMWCTLIGRQTTSTTPSSCSSVTSQAR